MRVAVTLECRFARTPDGSVWNVAMFTYPFWRRYLEVFDCVRVIARVLDVDRAPPGAARADGERVEVWPLPHYQGPIEYLKQRSRVSRAVRSAVQRDDAVILRVGSPIAALLQTHLHRQGHPYAVEVVGDPYDMFAPGAVRHPLRPLLRQHFARQLRQLCARAAAAAYVTQHALQRRYPPAAEAFATHYSDVILEDADFATIPREPSGGGPVQLITVGTLQQLYKAPDVLLEASAICIREGASVHLTIVGDGACQPRLERLAVALGIREQVRFLGKLPAGEAVRQAMDAADLFVLPSRQEGLPRAMIEAMARGLPCIGSTVGGIPELLSPEDLVSPGDAHALACKIREVVGDSARRTRMEQRNLRRAREYCESSLRPRRVEFYQHVRTMTENWLSGPDARDVA